MKLNRITLAILALSAAPFGMAETPAISDNGSELQTVTVALFPKQPTAISATA